MSAPAEARTAGGARRSAGGGLAAAVSGALVRLAEREVLPDAAVRFGIRRLVAARLVAEARGGPAERHERLEELLVALRRGPVTVAVDDANRQHYEVPAELYELVLGERLKYSACLWDGRLDDLDSAERRMLDLTLERSGIEDGDEVLELGCGWGSLTLWIAERFPRCRVTAVSNSASQRAWIEDRCAERGLGNVELITADVGGRFLVERLAGRRFDRAVSVEMFEHVRNQPELLRQVARWLRPGGTLFLHVFCHRTLPYLFEVESGDAEREGAGDWMARTFFTGGLMPSPELFLRMQDHLRVRRQWLHDGTHYQRTARAWLANLDRRREEARRVLARGHGEERAGVWLQRWRIFFMAVEELFGYRGGQEWMVSHTLYERPEG